MGLGERCDEIVQLIEKTLAEVGADCSPAPAAAVPTAGRQPAGSARASTRPGSRAGTTTRPAPS